MPFGNLFDLVCGQAGEEIERALKKGGRFCICFVVVADSGRVRPADLETMSIIAKAVSVPFEYGIIVNKYGTSRGMLALQEEVVASLLRMAETATGRPPRQVRTLSVRNKSCMVALRP